MKFKFCGDADCQDWILAQINLLSKFTVIKLKLAVNEVIVHLLTGELNYQKVYSLCGDTKLSEEESKGVVAALNFILTNSIKYDTESDVVCNELQQLGLPKEHSVTLCKSLSTNSQKLREAFRDKSVKFNSLTDLSFEIKKNLTNRTLTTNQPSLFLNLATQDTPKKSFYVDPDHLNLLISDLKDSLQIMENVNI